MPGRRLWSVALVLVVVASLLSGPVAAQTNQERSRPIEVERPSLGGLEASLAAVADRPGGDVTVRVDYSGSEADARRKVTSVGGRVLAAYGSALEVQLPAAGLRGLSRAEGIVSVREFIPPDPLSVTSQGVSSTGADAWHAKGLTGVGVKVAIVDFGFMGRTQAVASGDLPTNAITRDYCGGSLDGGTSHGTAVAEIVHDVAPAAQLYLVCVDTEFDLESFVDYAIAQEIDIINHSGAWFLSDRGDGTAKSPSASNAARRADAAGILWVAAAGNYAENHWRGAWNPVVVNGVVTFQKFGTVGGKPDYDMSTVVQSGQAISIFLKWDNWPVTSEDLDLYLWNATEIVGRSEIDQSTLIRPPTEQLTYVNTTAAPVTVWIEIREFSAVAPGELDMLIFGHSGLEYPVRSGSIADPAFSPHTVAVGASCFNMASIEGFSSLGPTIDGRIKPDFVSADGVLTRAYGGTNGACDGFIGTSASAPHVAGLAALIMHAAPNWTPERVVQALEDYSLDRGPTGKDNTFGFGDVVLGAVPAEDCQPVPTPVLGIAGPGTVVDTYSGSSVPAGSYLVKNNDGSLSLCVGPGTPASASASLQGVSLPGGPVTPTAQSPESWVTWSMSCVVLRCGSYRFRIN